MDPLLHLASTTHRAMIDNAQRSGDQLRSEKRKEVRKKKTRSTGDSSELSADCSGMSEDMLGDMDPDLGGGRAESFTQAWEEVLEDDLAEGEEGDQDDASDQSWFADPKETEDLPGHIDARNLEVDERKGDRQPHREESQEQQAPAEEQVGPDETQVSEESREPVPAEEAEEGTAEPRTPPPLATPSKKTAGDWNSLLAQSEGFLVAEEPATLDMELDELQSVSPTEFLEPTLADLSSRLIEATEEHPGRRPLQILLGRFGAGVLRLVEREKVRVVLMSEDETLMHDPQVREAFGDTSPTGACYLPEQRRVVVETRCVLGRPKYFHPVLYYFAHAFDHALGDLGFASFGSAVKANYQACQEGFNGQDFSDSLAEFSPVRYFAQAVEAFLNSDDCSEPLWSRNDLYDFDRSMYQYVEYLFRRLNG